MDATNGSFAMFSRFQLGNRIHDPWPNSSGPNAADPPEWPDAFSAMP